MLKQVDSSGLHSFRFVLNHRTKQLPASEASSHILVLQMTQEEFEDHQRLRDEVMLVEIERLGWEPGNVHWSASPIVPKQLLQALEERFAGRPVMLYYPSSFQYGHYKQDKVGGLAIRYQEFMHGIKVAPEFGASWPDVSEGDGVGPASFGLQPSQ